MTLDTPGIIKLMLTTSNPTSNAAAAGNNSYSIYYGTNVTYPSGRQQ